MLPRRVPRLLVAWVGVLVVAVSVVPFLLGSGGARVDRGAAAGQATEMRVPSTRLSFKGCVRKVKRSPRLWSGIVTSYQPVRYEIDRVISGRFSDDVITVQHLIMEGKDDVRGQVPELRRSLVHRGVGLRVTAVRARSPALGRIYVASEEVTGRPGLSCDDG